MVWRNTQDDDAVAEAMQRQGREKFLPQTQRTAAAEDRPLPLGHGQTNSQPTTVANMLRLLDVHQGHRVLDVGSGSGWTTALLAELAGPTGDVVGVEIVSELVSRANRTLAEYEIPADVLQADPDNVGAPERSPFDRILVSAEAARIPEALVEQLSDDGIMVIPVAQRMLRITKNGPHYTDRHITDHGAYRFVPLV